MRHLGRIGEHQLSQEQIFPDLDTLQHRWSIPPINTGTQRFLTGPSGIVTDDIEGLHAYQNEAGRLHLVSGVEFPDYLYRGQVQEELPCVPTIGRPKYASEKQRLLALCRAVAFEDALKVHPFVKKADQAGIHVDIEGLAQHYDLPTDMLDITGSFAVASFFATSRRDTEKGYLPVGDNAAPGVIYRVIPCILEDHLPDLFHLVGWQPLPRPEQQQAFALRMKPGQDFVHYMFTTEFAYFKQNAAISRRIWEEFDEGRALFPDDDPAAQLSKQAQDLCEFTESQMARAWSRFEAWECKRYSPDQRAALEVSSGITVRSSTVLTWNHLDVETRDDQLNNMIDYVFKRVRNRRAMYHA